MEVIGLIARPTPIVPILESNHVDINSPNFFLLTFYAEPFFWYRVNDLKGPLLLW